MSTPLRLSERILSVIQDEIDSYFHNLNEIFDSNIETEYEPIKKDASGIKGIAYRFKTNSGTSYDLEFIVTTINPDIILDDKSKIHDHLKNIDFNKPLYSIDIGFTLTERVKFDDNIDHAEYIKNTNKQEAIELMGRITNLIKKFIVNAHKINIYSIGRNTDQAKLNIYKTMFKNIFSNEFTMLEGESFGYKEGALYFINNNILK